MIRESDVIQKIKKDIDDEKISIQKNVYKLMKDIY